jgi:hypothetical protein
MKNLGGTAMKNVMVSLMAVGLACSITGCAIESDHPAESSSSSEVTVGVWNFVRSCTPLALRSCDDPGGCDTGVRLGLHSQVFVTGFNATNKMAKLNPPVGYARADGVDGEVYLSRLDGPCN